MYESATSPRRLEEIRPRPHHLLHPDVPGADGVQYDVAEDVDGLGRVRSDAGHDLWQPGGARVDLQDRVSRRPVTERGRHALECELAVARGERVALVDGDHRLGYGSPVDVHDPTAHRAPAGHVDAEGVEAAARDRAGHTQASVRGRRDPRGPH